MQLQFPLSAYEANKSPLWVRSQKLSPDLWCDFPLQPVHQRCDQSLLGVVGGEDQQHGVPGQTLKTGDTAGLSGEERVTEDHSLLDTPEGPQLVFQNIVPSDLFQMFLITINNMLNLLTLYSLTGSSFSGSMFSSTPPAFLPRRLIIIWSSFACERWWLGKEFDWWLCFYSCIFMYSNLSMRKRPRAAPTTATVRLPRRTSRSSLERSWPVETRVTMSSWKISLFLTANLHNIQIPDRGAYYSCRPD